MHILIHSPIVGPLTWGPVADELRKRGSAVLVPALAASDTSELPYWQQHAEAVTRALRALSLEETPVLVAHSGAGLLLPAIRQLLGRPVVGYVFVDAGIPQDGKGRLDMLADELGDEMANDLRRQLDGGARLPAWTDEDLRAEVPDADLRRQLVQELQPQPRAFYEEPIPVFTDWPDAPCAYLQFSSAYDGPARRAVESGWLYRRLHGGHFHMLVDPPAVSEALLGLIQEMA